MIQPAVGKVTFLLSQAEEGRRHSGKCVKVAFPDGLFWIRADGDVGGLEMGVWRGEVR